MTYERGNLARSRYHNTGNGWFDLSCQFLCRACTEEARTIYVHLCSGTLLKVGNVKDVRVTDSDVIIDCGEDQAVVLRREDVYFTSCELSLPPSVD